MSDISTFNNLLQWGAVIAILIIVAATICRRFIRLRKTVKSTDSTCACGCASCHLNASCKKPAQPSQRPKHQQSGCIDSTNR